QISPPQPHRTSPGAVARRPRTWGKGALPPLDRRCFTRPGVAGRAALDYPFGLRVIGQPSDESGVAFMRFLLGRVFRARGLLGFCPFVVLLAPLDAARAAGEVAVIVKSGSGQTAQVGTAFAGALQASVIDAFNNPLPFHLITFTAPASGAGGTFS